MELLKKVESVLAELEEISEEKELNLRNELEEKIDEFVKKSRERRREIEYLGVKIDINKIVLDYLQERFETAKKKYIDIHTVFKEIMPTLVLCQLVVNGIEDYNLEVLRKFSSLGKSSAYVSLDVLLDSFYTGNSEIVKRYGIEKHESK